MVEIGAKSQHKGISSDSSSHMKASFGGKTPHVKYKFCTKYVIFSLGLFVLGV